MKPDQSPKLKKGQFGACSYSRSSPENLSATTAALNFVISFEDALKLNLAIDECVHQLGRYNRATTAGKNTGLMLVIHLDKKRIRVLQRKVSRSIDPAKGAAPTQSKGRSAPGTMSR
jgi:hypothetical protein